MSNITTNNPKNVAREIDRLTKVAVKLRRGFVVDSLHHRSYLVRMAAAEALGWARIECAQLVAALAAERNELVLSFLCGGVADAGCTAALAGLEGLATQHPSSLVRSCAVVAISDLRGAAAGDFLWARTKAETSPRVRASLIALLVQGGHRDALKGLRRCLRSRDYIVRIRVANLLAGRNMGPFREEVLEAFRDALQVETTVAAREALERAVASA